VRYQRIFTHFWHDEKIRQLSEDGRLLFVYILTSPHSNSLGLYLLPKQYILADLGWDTKRLSKPFNELLDKLLIGYDEDKSLVLIWNQLKHNRLENGKQIMAGMKIAATLPTSYLFSELIPLLRKYVKPKEAKEEDKKGEMKQAFEQFIEQLQERVDKLIPESKTREREKTTKIHPLVPQKRQVPANLPVVPPTLLPPSPEGEG